jgi:hypothetical protein
MCTMGGCGDTRAFVDQDNLSLTNDSNITRALLQNFCRHEDGGKGYLTLEAPQQ